MTQFIDTLVGIFQSSGYAVAAVFFPHLIKARMLDQITSNQHTCLYAFAFNILNSCISVCSFLAGDQKSKPAWIGMWCCFREDEFIGAVSQRCL